MPIGTAVHARTFALCESLNFREWSGYYAVSAYESHHEHEYNAIRNAAALIDVSPLFKYMISGPDAARLVDRLITRDVSKMAVGQVFYTPWCDEHGSVIDDGTVSRIDEQLFRWTAADPSLRWFRQNAAGLRVSVEDVSEEIAALALQGPTSARVLRAASDVNLESLKYFRVASGTIGGVPVDISRTGYTGDLGYEVWMPAADAVRVWDVLMELGRPFDIKPAGMLALDVARVEAGLLLIDVDFFSSKKALIEKQKYTPYEMGLGRLVSLTKGRFIGQQALRAEHQRGPARQVVGLELDWMSVESIYEQLGLPPTVGATASRSAVPVYRGGQQVGRATTTTWSPVLKKMIALATVDRPHFANRTGLEIEVTVEAVRHRVKATVVPLPFFNPARKVAAAGPSARTVINLPNMPTRVTPWTFDRLLTGLVFLAIAVACALTPMQTDSWWQLRAGRDMWLSRSVLLTDVYSHTAYGTFWSNHEWLAEVVFYALVKAGGLPLLTLFATGLILGGWLISWSLASGPVRERFGWVALALMPASVWWEPRPHAFSLLFIMVTVALLAKQRFWWLPLVFVVWANCHGGVLLGFVLLGAGLGVQTLLAPRTLPQRGPRVSGLHAGRDGDAARAVLLGRNPELPGTHPPLSTRRVAPAAPDGAAHAPVLDSRGGLLLRAVS